MTIEENEYMIFQENLHADILNDEHKVVIPLYPPLREADDTHIREGATEEKEDILMAPNLGTEEVMVGGIAGHIFRRLWHIIFFMALPIIYYLVGQMISGENFIWPKRIVSAFCLVYMLLEIARLTVGFTCFGMRTYEAKQVSGNAWGVFSLCMVFLLAPTDWGGSHPGAIGIPLVWSLALGDPVLGETRRANLSLIWVIGSGMLTVCAVWIVCIFWLGTPWYLVLIFVPLTVACELPKLPWIDDNAVMLLVPLSCLLILEPWIPTK
jgi:hypothetical protein